MIDVIKGLSETGSSTNMRSKELILTAYDTDKIEHYYLEVNDAILSGWRDNELKLLEIGVRTGGSLKLWRDYFPRGAIVGIDLKLPESFVPGELSTYFSFQANSALLLRIGHGLAT
jgi:hypothetical protein